ncbi:MAG: XdhC family protein [Chloroflexi bacterium]|nr:XdhC family protein [Chloroflexota bacterium]
MMQSNFGTEELQAFLEAVSRNESVALATVVKNQGGEGPAVGARLVVWADGRTQGSLGNPGLDQEVRQDALEALAAGASVSMIYPKARVRTRRAEAEALLEVFIEVVQAPQLVVVGAGHIGYFVARLGKMVGFQVTVVDDREDFATAERFPEADQILNTDYTEALRSIDIDENTAFVLVSRGHKQDESALREVVGSEAGYVGMIGSRRRVGAVLKHQHEEGVPLEKLQRVRTPIGLDIGAETPQEIAVSILAELIMTRKGGTGIPMSQKERIPIE